MKKIKKQKIFIFNRECNFFIDGITLVICIKNNYSKLFPANQLWFKLYR